jgi:hypothetical protein
MVLPGVSSQSVMRMSLPVKVCTVRSDMSWNHSVNKPVRVGVVSNGYGVTE